VRELEDSSGYGLTVTGIYAAGDSFGVGGVAGFSAVFVGGDEVESGDWINEGTARAGPVSPVDELRISAGLGSGLECHPPVDCRAGALAILVRAE